ncbi:MAG: Ser-Thr-rich GPI-anchored membrane family protein [Thainema sp.]
MTVDSQSGSVGSYFNDDISIDILWHHSGNGANTAWFMDGISKIGNASLPSFAGWDLEGINDFNGDNEADILWRNYDTGENHVWFMSDSSFSYSASLSSVNNVNWQIEGTGDFNGDGETDILWRNYRTGVNSIWFMNGISRMSGTSLQSVNDVNWQIEGVGDFNSDGQSDILWRNYRTGANSVWFMNGISRMSGTSLQSVNDVNWQIEGTGDFNTDGKTDLLWRNYSTGANTVWLMNGTTRISGAALPTVSNTSWKPLIQSSMSHIYIQGSPNDDSLSGDSQRNIIYGDTGNDIIYGDSGIDDIYGDAGNDQLYGGNDDDHLYGGDDADFLNGDLGNDFLSGGIGNDELYGSGGNDYLNGDSGVDYLYGGAGNDELYGASGNDYIQGDSGDDTLYGGSQDDTLYGGAGVDFLYGETGNDEVYGGDSDDNLQGGEGVDKLNGDLGNDILSGGAGDDFLYGSDGNDNLNGDEGADFLSGGNDHDFLYGASGNDTIEGGSGNDYIEGGSQNDTLYGQLGNDILHGETGNDYLSGGDGNDMLSGGHDLDILDGYGFGITEQDSLEGGTGQDLFILGSKFYSYYTQNGDLDYAEIADFNTSEDTIQLKCISWANNEPTDVKGYYLAEVGQDTEIRLASNGDLVGLIKGVQGLSLSSPYFDFVSVENITVASPNGGNTLQAGTSHTITWNDNIGENVKIDLLQNGSVVQTIESSIGSDGQYTWTIPTNLTPGSNYKIRISSEADPSLFDDSDGFFTITAADQPDLVVTNASAPSSITIGDTVTISADTLNSGAAAAGTSVIKYWLSNDSVLNNNDIFLGSDAVGTLGVGNSETDSHSFTYQSSWGLEPKYILFKVDGSNVVAESNETNNVFAHAITVQPEPYITVIAPNNYKSLQISQSYDITWDDNIGENVTIELYRGGTFIQTIASSTESDGSFTWENLDGLDPANDYRIQISSFTDPSLFDSSETFAIISSTGDITADGISYSIKLDESGQVQPFSLGESIVPRIILSEDIDFGRIDVSFFISTDTTFSENDKVFGWANLNIDAGYIEYLVSGLNLPGQDDEFWNQFGESTIRGSRKYYLGLKVDSSDEFNETNEFNNVVTTGILIDLPTIHVSSPTSSSTLQAGTSYSITWSDNIDENVQIDLYQDGSFAQTIESSTISDGEYNWSLSANLEPGSNYTIRISSTSDPDLYDDGGTFSITAPAQPDLTVTNQSVPSSITVGESVTVSADVLNNGTDPAGASTFTYWLSDDAILDSGDIKVGSIAVGNLSAGGSESISDSFVYDASWGLDPQYILFVADSNDSVSETNETNNVVAQAITVEPEPYVTITSPNGGDTFNAGQDYNLTWDDNISGNVKIELYKGSVKIQDVINSTESDGSYLWTLPTDLATGNDYKIRITSLDDGNVTDFSDTFFSIGEVIDPGVTTSELSGDDAIDALLHESLRKWDTSSNGGIMTFSFLDSSAASSYTSEAGQNSEVFSELTESIKKNVREILEMLERYIDIDFVEVNDTVDSFGVMRFMFSDGVSYAQASYPGYTLRAGDVRLNPDYADSSYSGFSGEAGTHGYETIIHEIGHALGLKHSGNYDNEEGIFLSPEEDNNTNTVMTYNSVGGDTKYTSADSGGKKAITAMPYDIRALQYLYGSKIYQSDATDYSFSSIYEYETGGEFFGSSAISVKQALWDSDGIDTLNFSILSSTDEYHFDLNQGGMLTTVSAYDGSYYYDRAQDSNLGDDISEGSQYRTSSFGTSIAYGTIIENLVNSGGSDTVFANSVSNVFSGYSKDTLTGLDTYNLTSSDDILDLGDYTFSDITASTSGGSLTLGLASNGSIDVNDYYGSSGSMKFKVGGSLYTYNASSGWQAA